MTPSPQAQPRPDTVWTIFRTFLWLGITSFGGPVAHLGYFRTEFVERRRWLDDRSYSDLVALCQFLPGPASSQVGMALGLGRAGWSGLLAAWAGFTLPSALLMIALATGLALHPDVAGSGWIHGLKVAAVAVVAKAVWDMARILCPDPQRIALALLAAAVALALPTAFGQVAAITLAGLWGRLLVSAAPTPVTPAWRYPVTRPVAASALMLLAALLIGLPLWAAQSGTATASLVDGVYRAGALVFGGGHVVLPLLETTVVASGSLDNDAFLAGYGAAQAVPGPLFTFAAYLGALADWPLQGWTGGVVLLVVIFLPALLVLVAALPYWALLHGYAGMRAAMAGVNAGVVGILLAAFYDPVMTHGLLGGSDVALALGAFVLLHVVRAPPALVVILAAGCSGLMTG